MQPTLLALQAHYFYLEKWFWRNFDSLPNDKIQIIFIKYVAANAAINIRYIIALNNIPSYICCT